MSRSPVRAWTSRFFRAVLRLYPPGFRRHLGPDLETALEDRLDAAWSRPWAIRVLLIGRVALDVLVAALRERLWQSALPSPPHPTHRGDAVRAFGQDLRFAARSLARRPLYTSVALLTLTLGIGSSTAVFTVVDTVLLEPLPFAQPDELFMAWSYDLDRGPVRDGIVRGWMSQPDIESLRELEALEAVEGIMTTGAVIGGPEGPERVVVARSTGGILSLLGVAPLLGRDLRHDDDDIGAAAVVVISHRLWQSRFGGDPDVIGRTIEINEQPWEVVGVAPATSAYPPGIDVWTAYRNDATRGCGRGCHIFDGALVRLADGTSVEVGSAAVAALAASLAEEYPGSNIDKGLHLERLLDYRVGDVRRGLWIVFGAVGLVLLIVCANMANLLWVRASTRAREVAVRRALGAPRARLFTQVITESLGLAAVGGALGYGVALSLLRGLRALAVDRIPRVGDAHVDGTALVFLVCVTAGVALLFGMSPALHLTSRRGAEPLLGGARTGGRTAERARAWLLTAEVAFSILLLAGAGLLLRSLDELYAVDLGFDGAHVTRFSLSLPAARYSDLGSIVPFYRRLEDRLAELPGVERVGSVYGAPLTDGSITGTVRVEGRPDPTPGEETGAALRSVTPDYFATMGISILRGRGIEDTDDTGGEPVAVVNEEFVRQNFPGEEVLGRRVRVSADFGFGSPFWRVVGVVRDVRRSMSGSPVAEVYPPHSQFGPGFLTVHVAVRPEAGSLAAALRAEVARLDPNLVVRDLETVAEAKRRDTAETRFFLVLVTIFAGLAVVLAAIGLYGVVAFLVSQRTRELGIRMALGAGRASVTGLVLGQGLRPAVAGVVLGVVLALYAGRVVEGLLFGVRPSDPLVLAGASGLVLLMAAAATLIPARRAVAVDPTVALRVE